MTWPAEKSSNKTDNLSPFTASVSAAGTDLGGSIADTPPPTATEGAVGTPITPTEASIQATLGQYVNKTAYLKSLYIGELLN